MEVRVNITCDPPAMSVNQLADKVERNQSYIRQKMHADELDYGKVFNGAFTVIIDNDKCKQFIKACKKRDQRRA